MSDCGPAFVMSVVDLYISDHLEVQKKKLEGRSMLKSSFTENQNDLRTTKIDRRIKMALIISEELHFYGWH